MIDVGIKGQDRRAISAEPGIVHQTGYEIGIDTNGGNDRQGVSADMSLNDPQGADSDYQRVNSEYQAYSKISSLLLLGVLRGGSSSEEVDEEGDLSTSSNAALSPPISGPQAVSTPNLSADTTSSPYTSINPFSSHMPSPASPVPPNRPSCSSSVYTSQSRSPAQANTSDPEKHLQTDQQEGAPRTNDAEQGAVSPEHPDEHEPERRNQSTCNHELQKTPHPAFMTDEEFEALPCWSDVEDDPAYNIGRTRRTVSDTDVRRYRMGLDAAPSQGIQPGETTTPHINPPPGLSPTPRFAEAFDRMSLLSLNNSASGQRADAVAPGDIPPSYPSSRASFIGTVNSESFMELLRARGSYPGELRPDPSSSRDAENALVPWNGSEWSVYHIGDGLPPRDPQRQSIARNQTGQREAWIITPGRPPRSSLEIARTLASRRLQAPTLSHLNEIDQEPDGSESNDLPQVYLRGGAGEEDEEQSQHESTAPPRDSTPPPPERVPTPYPEPWLQRLSLQGDHQTIPFDLARATSVFGRQEATPHRSPLLTRSRSAEWNQDGLGVLSPLGNVAYRLAHEGRPRHHPTNLQLRRYLVTRTEPREGDEINTRTITNQATFRAPLIRETPSRQGSSQHEGSRVEAPSSELQAPQDSILSVPTTPPPPYNTVARHNSQTDPSIHSTTTWEFAPPERPQNPIVHEMDSFVSPRPVAIRRQRRRRSCCGVDRDSCNGCCSPF